MNAPAAVSRRSMLVGASLSAAGALLPAAAASAATAAPGQWDHETDILCVGSGAAAGCAAVVAAAGGARVMVVEKMPLVGGTTAKSGGVAWICNHFILRQQGIRDEKADAIAYMARYSFPQLFDRASATYGLEERDYKLIEAFYDNGSEAIDRLRELDAVQFKQFRLFQLDEPAPDYADHLPENKVPSGRALEPAVGSGASDGGGSLAVQLETWLRKHDVPILTDTRVTAVIKENERVIGVEAEQEGKSIRIRARKAVIFGTGGYAHNVQLCNTHQLGLYGSCATPGATGDFIEVAAAAGAQMGQMDGAWRTQVLFEEALENRAVALGAFFLPGDSMIVVNKYGRRIVNEKRDYNDRTRIHFAFDPSHEEYPNQLLFMIFDERSLDRFGGAFPFPAGKGESPWLISGRNWAELAGNIGERLEAIKSKSGGVALDANFLSALQESVTNFNGYAKAGVDSEFGRGRQLYDTQWHKLFSWPREGTSYPLNSMPNPTMHPIAEKGPYYAFILAAGALDTNSGPRINEHAQVLAAAGEPITGLYGAGNCISAPSRNAYYGAGGTIGPALAFGYIAARHALGLESA